MAKLTPDTSYTLTLSREEAVFLRELLGVVEIDEDKMEEARADIESASNTLIHLHEAITNVLGHTSRQLHFLIEA